MALKRERGFLGEGCISDQITITKKANKVETNLSEEDKYKIKELEDKLVKSMKSGFNYEEMEKVSAEIEKIKELTSKRIDKFDQKIDVVGENIPDWDWPNGGIDEFLDSLKTNKSSKIEKSNKHEKWL